jgi:hypothetical protein
MKYTMLIIAILAIAPALACKDCCQTQNNTIVIEKDITNYNYGGGGLSLKGLIRNIQATTDTASDFWRALDNMFVSHSEYERRIEQLEDRVDYLEAENLVFKDRAWDWSYKMQPGDIDCLAGKIKVQRTNQTVITPYGWTIIPENMVCIKMEAIQ